MGKFGAGYSLDQSHFSQISIQVLVLLTSREVTIFGVLEVSPSKNRRGNRGGETKASHDGDQSKRLEKLHVVKRDFGRLCSMVFFFFFA